MQRGAEKLTESVKRMRETIERIRREVERERREFERKRQTLKYSQMWGAGLDFRPTFVI